MWQGTFLPGQECLTGRRRRYAVHLNRNAECATYSDAQQINRLNVSLFTPSLLFSKVAFFLSPGVPLFSNLQTCADRAA